MSNIDFPLPLRTSGRAPNELYNYTGNRRRCGVRKRHQQQQQSVTKAYLEDATAPTHGNRWGTSFARRPPQPPRPPSLTGADPHCPSRHRGGCPSRRRRQGRRRLTCEETVDQSANNLHATKRVHTKQQNETRMKCWWICSRTERWPQ